MKEITMARIVHRFPLALLLLLAACDTVEAPQVAPDEASAEASFVKQAKVNVCHLGDSGEYVKITVAQPAVDAHLKHGDDFAGREVLDEYCQPIPPICPCLVSPPLPSEFEGEYNFVEQNDLTSTASEFRLSLRYFGDSGEINSADFYVTGAACRAKGVTDVMPPINWHGNPFGYNFSLTPAQEDACRNGLIELHERVGPVI